MQSSRTTIRYFVELKKCHCEVDIFRLMMDALR